MVGCGEISRTFAANIARAVATDGQSWTYGPAEIVHHGREMSEPLIVSDPKIMMGKPVISGTRITVESILERLAAGETTAEILQAHPRLTEEGIRQAIGFAARVLRADVVYPVSATMT